MTKDPITYENFILLCKACLDDTTSSINDLFEKLCKSSEYYRCNKFIGIDLYPDRGRTLLSFFNHGECNKDNIGYTVKGHSAKCDSKYLGNDGKEKIGRELEKMMARYAYMSGEWDKALFSMRFYVNNVPLLVRLNPITNLSSNSKNEYAKICIMDAKGDVTNTFYYKYSTNELYRGNGNQMLLLSDDDKRQILGNLPSYDLKSLPKELLDYMRRNESLTKEEANKFLNLIAGKENIDNSNVKISSSIKQILLGLKKSGYNAEEMPKITITDNFFFSKIDEDRKIIDDFFNDEDILKYCDLSKIDFTNADIRGFYLANTNAKLNINKVYNKDISNSNLEGVSLFGQDLAGIMADGANLIGTHVIVSVDQSSIIGTSFDSNSMFFIKGRNIDLSEARAMGLNIIEAKENTETGMKL